MNIPDKYKGNCVVRLVEQKLRNPMEENGRLRDRMYYAHLVIEGSRLENYNVKNQQMYRGVNETFMCDLDKLAARITRGEVPLPEDLQEIPSQLEKLLKV